MIKIILGVVLPCVLICVLLIKAKNYAKKGAGEIGEVVMKGAKFAGGLALGAAAGGLALAGSNTVGRIARNAANNDETKAKAAAGDKGAQRKLALANSFAKNSFDARQTGIGKFASQKSGMDFNKGTGIMGLSTENLKGGRKERDEEKFKKTEEKKKSYELSPAAAATQNNLAEKQNARHAEYETDSKLAKKLWDEDEDNKKNGVAFDEEAFQRDYQRGGNLKTHYKLDKTVEGGSVEKGKTAAQVNAERGAAYGYSLAHPMEKGNKDKGAIKNFLTEWRRGMTDVVTSKGGLATTGVAIAATGGIGALAVPVLGLAQAIKAMVPVTKDLEARIAKGKTEDQKLLELLKNRPGIAPVAPKVEEVKKEEPKK
jgi:hypothetical protein